MSARGRIPYNEADPATLRHVADSLDEDAQRYANVVRLNPGNSEPQQWVVSVLRRNAKKLRRLALIVDITHVLDAQKREREATAKQKRGPHAR